jgi:hypothetical protein
MIPERFEALVSKERPTIQQQRAQKRIEELQDFEKVLK